MGADGIEPSLCSLSENCFTIKLRTLKTLKIIAYCIIVLYIISTCFTSQKLLVKRSIQKIDIYIGYLEDLIFLAAENPIVTKIIIRGKDNQRLIISTDYLQKVSKNLTIEKEFLVTNLEENELYLVKNLLDKQIIDLKGSKIVRLMMWLYKIKKGYRLPVLTLGFWEYFVV